MATNKEKCFNLIKKLFSTESIIKKVGGLVEYQEIFTLPEILEIFENDEILSTASLFLENNLNLAQASKNGYMHRNTMIYRIEKIEKNTGLNIKKFEDAVIFDNMKYIYNQLKNQ